MTTYPIQVSPLHDYFGDDAARQRSYQRDVETANRIESFINGKVEAERGRRSAVMITFGEIASHLNLDERKVHGYLFRFSGSSDNSIEIQTGQAPG